MKNTISKHHEAVLAVVKKQAMSIDSIKEELPKISHVMLVKAVKDLMTENSIVLNDDGTYSFAGAEKKAEAQPKDAKADKKEVVKTEVKTTANPKEEDDDLGAPSVSGRDYSKYDFNGLKALSKSRLVQAVIKEYVSKNGKATLAKLQEVFKSEQIQKRYGIAQELSAAKKISGTRERYFMKPEDILKVGNQKVVVCNQWSSETLKPLLAIAKGLGYKITVSK